MEPAEAELIEKIQRFQVSDGHDYHLEREIVAKLKAIVGDEKYFGHLSDAFINHGGLINFLNQAKPYGLEEYFLRFKIEAYLLAVKADEPSQTEKLNEVEEAFKKCMEMDTSVEKKKSGTALLPSRLVEYQFIRNIFLTENEALIGVVLNYLPMPPAKVFDGYPLPEMIAKRAHDSTETINTLLSKHDKDSSLLDRSAMTIQRAARTKIRKEEESQRIYQRYHRRMTKAQTDAMREDANTPYTPQCDVVQFPGLREKIMDAAKEVKLFDTVKHLTAPAALGKILEGGLYGRRRLLQAYLPFKPAVLELFDIEQGDGNVVCLGANKISSSAEQGAQLTFDVDKIIAGKPAAFYKQRDLGFNLQERRDLKIGELNLIFSHTTRTNSQPDYKSPFILYQNDTDNRVKAVAYIPADLLIAYDLKKMHEILTLNFFRFVDALYMPWDPDASCLNKEEIYSALNALSKEELVATLQEIGRQMTDTMEFNFYGAYQIDFSALLTIHANNYTLALPAFIEALNNGQVDKLNEAKEYLPQIFESERFITYLCENISNAEVIEALNPSGSSALRP